MTPLRAKLDKASSSTRPAICRRPRPSITRSFVPTPGQPDALNLLGVIANQSGQPEIAVDLIGKASPSCRTNRTFTATWLPRARLPGGM